MPWKYLFVVTSSLLVTACGTFPPEQPKFDNAILLPTMISSTARTLPPSTTTPAGGKTAVGKPAALEPLSCQTFDQASTKTPQDRNECITDLMTVIDDAFQKYQISVNSDVGTINFALDALSTTGSAVATATTGTTAKVMSAISSVASGSKTAFSEDLLYKATMQVLLTTMKGNRDKDSAAIKLAMQQNLTTYPMSVARNDLLKYLYDGTLIEAFASVTQNASATAQACSNANQAVSNAAKAGSLSADTAKSATAQSSAATTPQTQCAQMATAISFQFDASPTATTLFGLLVSTDGKVNKTAIAALRACAKTVTAPAGFDIGNYKNPDGTVDVAQLAGDQSVDATYKASLLSCTQAALKAPAGP